MFKLLNDIYLMVTLVVRGGQCCIQSSNDIQWLSVRPTKRLCDWTEFYIAYSNLASVDSVMAVNSAPVNIMGFPLISMLTVQQESFSDTMALR